MHDAELSDRLVSIERALTALDALAERLSKDGKLDRAIHDILETYGQISMIRETMHAQRAAIELLIGRLDRLLALMTAHDAAAFRERAVGDWNGIERRR